MLPGFTVPSSLGKARGRYATASVRGAGGLSLSASTFSVAIPGNANWGVSPAAIAPLVGGIGLQGFATLLGNTASSSTTLSASANFTSAPGMGVGRASAEPFGVAPALLVNACIPSCGPCLADDASRTGCSQTCQTAQCEPVDKPCTGCTTSCSLGLTLCGNTCKDVSNDPQNCGSCGNACPVPANSSATCSNRVCGFLCNPGYSQCGNACCPSGSTCCSGACNYLASDPQNCGACGHSCADQQICQNGACVQESCTPGTLALCYKQAEADYGACMQDCLPGSNTCTSSCATKLSAEKQACNAQYYCPPGATCCHNGKCANLATDTLNCGACGNVCSPGMVCCNGVCLNPSDFQSDPNNCGACGIACTGGKSCSKGVCVCPAPPTQWKDCGGVCTAVMVDPHNCSDCGLSCPPDVVCCGGVCGCPPNLVCCGQSCVSLETNAYNCGKCGNSCDFNSTGKTCQNGVCGCPPNTSLCGSVCCGGLLPTCCNGKCCPRGWGCCSGECKYLSNDPTNCGSCGNACTSTQMCVDGVCITCAASCQACDLASGECGLPCPQNTACKLMAASGSDNDYAVLSKYLTSQGFALASTEAVVLLQSGAVVGSSYNATLSGSGGEAIISFIANSSYASQGSYALLSQNSVLQYVLFVDANGTIAKVLPPSNPGGSSTAPRTVPRSITSPSPSPSPNTCSPVCNLVCHSLLWGSCAIVGAVVCPALGVPTGGLAFAGCIAAVVGACQYIGTNGCVPTCSDLCQCAATGPSCGVPGGCCPVGYACINGECQLLCPSPPYDACATYNSDIGQCYTCKDFDPCFACDTTQTPPVCALVGTVRCGQPGQPGYTCCPVLQACCAGACLDIQNDPQNCGGCNQPCTPGLQTCEGGKCVCIGGGEPCAGGCCGAGQTCCGTTCVDLQTDSQNCRGCGNACVSGEGCCNGACTPLDTTSNCGRCGNACATGQACCNGVCTDLTTTSNCGQCGNACTAGQGCCNGSCKDLATDANNCGACGMVCIYSGTMGSCSGGRCYCPSGEFACTKTGRGDDELCCSQVCCASSNPPVCCSSDYPWCFPGGYCCTDQSGSECVAGSRG
jgi:hypothetical protein